MQTRAFVIFPSRSRLFRLLLGLWCGVIVLAGYTAGAAGDKSGKSKDDSEFKEPKTIGDVAAIAGLQSYPVRGVGLVVGLADTGSDPAPGPDRLTLLGEMQKRGVRNPEEVLRSSTTALVHIRARIPPGVRSCKSAGCWCKLDNKKKNAEAGAALLRPHKGDTFDVEVEIPARDAATSLKGGWLLEAWLFEVADLPGAGAVSGHVLARAEGAVLVNGGLDGQEASPADLKRGRVLGGAVANDDRDFALLTEGDRTARWTIQVSSRINERFTAKNREGKPVADPKDGQRVVLRIPPRYRQNIARYLEVLRFMPIAQSGSQEAERMLRYADDLTDPAKARVAAVKLEGIGHRAIDTLKKGADSTDPDVRFFAAEALAYLGEPKAGEPLGVSAREIPEYRAHSLTALSSLDEPISLKTLHELLDGNNSVELRYGAFRAVRVLDPEDPFITGEVVGDQLYLHQVATNGTPFIHVTSRERAEVVLFGRDLPLETPLLLKVGNKIMLTAGEGADKIQLRRFDAGQDVYQQSCEPKLRDVIRKAISMGATYPDIVGMLVQADRQHNLPGRLEIDTLPDPTRIIARIQRVSTSSGKANDNVAMQNLFRWSDPRKSSVKSKSEDGEKVASTDTDEDSKTRKPSLWDRLRRRSAN